MRERIVIAVLAVCLAASLVWAYTLRSDKQDLAAQIVAVTEQAADDARAANEALAAARIAARADAHAAFVAGYDCCTKDDIAFFKQEARSWGYNVIGNLLRGYANNWYLSAGAIDRKADAYLEKARPGEVTR